MELEHPESLGAGPEGSAEGGGKRRRPEKRRGGTVEEEDDDESPSKRGHDESGIVTCRDLRLMLGQHMRKMKKALGDL